MLSSSPFVGQTAVTDGATTMSFDIHGEDVSRFLRSLKDRKMVCVEGVSSGGRLTFRSLAPHDT